MWRALCWLEVTQQAREPLTTLYAFVFFLLAFGYTASGAVELVGDRGAVPKVAPWALALAFGGLTAFGQVITTMVVATAMLRDSATRTLSLLVATCVSPRTWFSARLCAALVVLTCVYLAIPLGAWLGAVVAHARMPDAMSLAASGTAQQAAPTLVSFVLPFVVVTVPTCVIVAVLLGSVAAFSQRVMWVLAAALALVGLWQLSLALEAREATRTIGALLDPFANAPVLAATHAWTVAERATRPLPANGLVLWNRLWWTVLCAGVAAVAVWRVRWPGFAAPARVAHQSAPTAARVDARFDRRSQGSQRSQGSRLQASGHTSAFVALTRFTATWMLHDGGWRVVMGLAVLNATINAWARTSVQASSIEVLALVAEHSRLFLILLATVYAGEVLWRERETRVDALCDSTSVHTSVLAGGRLAGLFLAQLPVVLLLGLCALMLIVAKPADGANKSAAMPFLAWLLFVVWLPFAHLTALSVAVHAIVRHKVMAHLLLITGWVVAVTLNRQGANAWWYRFAESAPLMQLSADGVDQVAWRALAARAAWWSMVSVPLLWLTIRRWPRGHTKRNAR